MYTCVGCEVAVPSPGLIWWKSSIMSDCCQTSSSSLPSRTGGVATRVARNSLRFSGLLVSCAWALTARETDKARPSRRGKFIQFSCSNQFYVVNSCLQLKLQTLQSESVKSVNITENLNENHFYSIALNGLLTGCEPFPDSPGQAAPECLHPALQQRLPSRERSGS